MSNIHILTADEKGNYQVVAHFTVPPGNNSAGIAWKAALIADGQNTTIMAVPPLEQEEYDDIIAGNVLEFVITLKRLESGGGGDASVTVMVADRVAQIKKQLQRKYKYYGKTL